MHHSFQTKTFTHLTYCDLCQQLLWGLMKQGVECNECGQVFHKKCAESSLRCSRALPERFLDDNEVHTGSPAENYLRSLQQEQIYLKGDTNSSKDSIRNTDSLYFYDMIDTERKKKIRERSTLENIYAILISNKFQRMVAEAATRDDPTDNYLSQRVPLNAQVTARNFTRFVSRCGPVFSFRDAVVALVSWQNRIKTWISLAVYCLLCIYPKLLFIFPEIILIYYILQSYTEKTDESKRKKSKPQQTKITKKTEPSVTASTEKDKKKTTESPSIFSFNIIHLFQTSSEESPEYVRNLQNIQNTMGEFSDVYDWIENKICQYDLTSEEEVSMLLQSILMFSVVLSVILYFISIQMIFLSLGLIVYMSNTQFMKYMAKQLKPYIQQSNQRRLKYMKEMYASVKGNCSISDKTKELSVYENETSNKHGMKSWSDYTGKTIFSGIDDVTPPKHYIWSPNTGWTIDKTGPWIDDYLGIEVIVVPDEEGWVYYDTHWNKMDNGNSSEFKTRRRRWIRKCGRVE
ncbi:integral peroxisomal membrane peroxin-domain-containing protein [Pilobolus umbonatus]|nr:integral peroxisomal membrane peroxin-domain-containing protein [Pilobolus umbonatus]